MNNLTISILGAGILVIAVAARYEKGSDSVAISSANASAPSIEASVPYESIDDQPEQPDATSDHLADDQAKEYEQAVDAWREYAQAHVERVRELETRLMQSEHAANKYADQLMNAGAQLRECVSRSNAELTHQALPQVSAKLKTTCWNRQKGYFDCEVTR